MRINDFGIVDYPTGGTLGPRTLSDHEILWVERGECRWEFDDRTELCPPGSVLLCPRGMVDTWTWDPVQLTRHGYVHFEFLRKEDVRLPMRRDCVGQDVLRPLLRHAVWLASLGGAENERLAEAALRQALMWFAAGPTTQTTHTRRGDIHPVIMRALRALRTYWGNNNKVPPPVSEWATASGVSRGHLARVCRQELNVTPQELLRYLRLDHGLLWLGRTNLKISEISEMSGFQSQFHFSRAFKEAYGASPREMRKRLRAGDDRPTSKVISMRRMMQIIG